jgi:hypothetical protein
VARIYSDNVIRATCDVLFSRGVLASPSVDFSDEDIAWIREQSIEPLSDMRKVYPEGWDAAVEDLRPQGENLAEAVGLSRITREQADWFKQLTEFLMPGVFLNEGTKRRDDAGSIFLLFVTEHLRNTEQGKPHFELAFNLMRSLQDGLKSKIDDPGESAKNRVWKLKHAWGESVWKTHLRNLEQMVDANRTQIPVEKVN